MMLVVLLFSVLGAGCRQPDGAIPELDAEDQNRVSDIGRDLVAIARGESEEIEGLVKDLTVFVEDGSPGLQQVREFALHLGESVKTATFSGQTADEIARTTWMLVAVTDLSERQRQTLEADLRRELTAAGVPDQQIGNLVAEMPAVQRAVSTRSRRWYEVL